MSARERGKEGRKSTHLIRHYALLLRGGQVYVHMENLQSGSEFVKQSRTGDRGIWIMSGYTRRRRTGHDAKDKLGRRFVSKK